MRKIGSGSQGRADHTKADIHHPELFVEAKNRRIYVPVAAALTRVREAARREGRLGVLLFPAAGALAVHSQDLVAVSRITTGDAWRFVHWVRADVVPALRSRFADLEDAGPLAAAEAKEPVLAFRVPRSRGFVLVMAEKAVYPVSLWRRAGAEWVASRGGPAVDQDEMQYINADDWARHLSVLSKFDHHWHPPKRRNTTHGEVPSV